MPLCLFATSSCPAAGVSLLPAKFVARHPNLVGIEVSNFKCGHDALAYQLIQAILETAVMALWQDHSWTSASFLELMRFAEKTVNFRKVSAVAGAGTSVGEADAEVGHEISGFPRPR